MTNKEKLIAKLYKSTCSRDELETLLDLIKAAPDENYEEVMAKLWDELKAYPELEQRLASEMMQELFNRIEAQESIEPREAAAPTVHTSTRFRRRRLLQMAGAAALLLLVGMLSWLWLGTQELVTTKTAFAEQKTIVLPDGSSVKLNANSSIKYHKTWDEDKPRQVWLEGEAYFEVQKKLETGQKFEVITEDLTVQVLGTIFNVNARETSTEVFLEEGKVNLDLKQQTEDILMDPGELLTYSKSSGKSTKKQIENEAPASWKDGTAILRDAPLAAIIQKIHELYEVTVVVDDKSNLDREFTIFLPVDDPDTGYNMLEGLGLKVQKADKIWTIQ
ncbi:MAG: FecR domain-containing protein [Sinomicrobium sp.]|nr:FecR domain-containing protein [Sinomicrobium sp.]